MPPVRLGRRAFGERAQSEAGSEAVRFRPVLSERCFLSERNLVSPTSKFEQNHLGTSIFLSPRGQTVHTTVVVGGHLSNNDFIIPALAVAWGLARGLALAFGRQHFAKHLEVVLAVAGVR